MKINKKIIPKIISPSALNRYISWYNWWDQSLKLYDFNFQLSHLCSLNSSIWYLTYLQSTNKFIFILKSLPLFLIWIHLHHKVMQKKGSKINFISVKMFWKYRRDLHIPFYFSFIWIDSRSALMIYDIAKNIIGLPQKMWVREQWKNFFLVWILPLKQFTKKLYYYFIFFVASSGVKNNINKNFHWKGTTWMTLNVCFFEIWMESMW